MKFLSPTFIFPKLWYHLVQRLKKTNTNDAGWFNLMIESQEIILRKLIFAY